MREKQRLSASVDADLIAAGRAAVAAGMAASLSGWVSDALRLKVDHDRRLRALDDFLATYEASYGEITEEEMREATRRARGRAVVVRGESSAKRASPRRRGRGVA